VNPCKWCGADLPEEAKFCLQCGRQIEPPQPAVPSEPPKDLDFIQPALAGGMFLGLLSSIPVVSAGNCLCCMWVLGGGAMATFMLSKQRPGITYGDGAFAGVLSGVFGAVVATLVSIPVRIISARMFGSQEQAMEELFEQMPGAEGALKDLFMRLASPEISALNITATLFMNMIVFSLFAMIGGILMIAFLQKQAAKARLG
jgi:hypothetical protein